MPWQSIYWNTKKHTSQGHGTLRGTLFVFFVGALLTLQGVLLQLANLNGLIPLGQVIQYTSLGVQQPRLYYLNHRPVGDFSKWFYAGCNKNHHFFGDILSSGSTYDTFVGCWVSDHSMSRDGFGAHFSTQSFLSFGATDPPQTAVAASVFGTKMKGSGIN